jgi:hypothetical protein
MATNHNKSQNEEGNAKPIENNLKNQYIYSTNKQFDEYGDNQISSTLNPADQILMKRKNQRKNLFVLTSIK